VIVAGVDITDAVRIGGGDICKAWRGTTPDGRPVFAKALAEAPAGFFAAEAAGLALIRVDGAPPVPEARAVAEDGLVLDWVESGSPGVAAARNFGRRLAALHSSAEQSRAGESFGADRPGFIGSLPLDNTPADDWPAFYAERRLAPYLSAVDGPARVAVERVIDALPDLGGPPEPPARLHGDLWSGNLLWAADGQVWLVDAGSAHFGHRETDLAMLALFGAPHLDEVLTAYAEVAPLAPGWRQRVPLHQLHPLLVHAQLFGGHYIQRVRTTAELALRARR
jgi:fructosamine-3-kinase